MTSLNRLVVAWSGPQVVGLAVNVLHFSASDNSAPPVAAVRTAFQGLAPYLPTGVTISFPTSGDVIDDTTGHLTGVWSAAATGNVVGSAPAAAPAGVGACIGLTTGGIVNGKKGPRRLRGRMFIVPLSNNAYDINGLLVTGAVSLLTTFGTAMQASGPLAVWHRPTTPGGSDGNSYGVISTKVRNKVAYLSSRRD